MDSPHHESLLYMLTARRASEAGNEEAWREAEAEGTPLMHEAFVHALVDMGLIKGIFESPADRSEVWMIWSDSVKGAMKLAAMTPLAQAGLLESALGMHPVRTAHASGRLRRAMRPAAPGEFHRWLMGDGISLDEMKAAWERPHITESESVVLGYLVWRWLRAGAVHIPNDDSMKAAEEIRIKMLDFLRASRRAEEAEKLAEEDRRKWSRVRGFFAERGVDVEKAFEIWKSRGWSEGDPVPEDWWIDPAILLPGADDEDYEDHGDEDGF